MTNSKQPEPSNEANRKAGFAVPNGSARRDKTKAVLILLQIVLLPLCTAIAQGTLAKACFAVATMSFTLRIYLKTLDG